MNIKCKYPITIGRNPNTTIARFEFRERPCKTVLAIKDKNANPHNHFSIGDSFWPIAARFLIIK